MAGATFSAQLIYDSADADSKNSFRAGRPTRVQKFHCIAGGGGTTGTIQTSIREIHTLHVFSTLAVETGGTFVAATGVITLNAFVANSTLTVTVEGI